MTTDIEREELREVTKYMCENERPYILLEATGSHGGCSYCPVAKLLLQ
jgi:hypothetical protein